MSENNEVETIAEEHKKLATATFISPVSSVGNPWTSDDIDKMEITDLKEFQKLVNACRFFYKHDPLGGQTIDKLVDIGINELVFGKSGLSENEFRVFLAIKEKLESFADEMALEFLLSGLVVPEIAYASVNKNLLKTYGIKKYDTLVLPTSMWLRDPETIKINSAMLGDEVSYFVKIPKEIIYFIQHSGTYPDNTKDPALFEKLKIEYPEFVSKVLNGETEVLLENSLIFRRRPLSNDPYPTPYLYRAIEPMKHKRNLRRMDYAIAARTIGAIQLFRLGSDLFPVTEEDKDIFTDIQQQMLWRDGTGKDIERIFQLFANHTLAIDWIVPPLDALLNDTKYKDVNRDILYALGFPLLLISGESERTGTSNPEFSTLSPVKSMDTFREKILIVLKDIVRNVAELNHFKTAPELKFAPLNLEAFKDYVGALTQLYTSGNISREDYSAYFGIDWAEQMDKKEAEQKILEEKKLGEFAPQPFSPNPAVPGGGDQPQPNKPQSNKPKPPKTQ